MSKKSETSLGRLTAVFSMVVLLGICAAFTPKTWARYSGGTGDPNDPYRIATAEDLNDIGNYEEDWDKHFILVNDVNLAGRTYSTAVIAPDVNNSNWEFDGTSFIGVFDGNDHKIVCLTIDDGGAGNDFLGLFGYIHYGEVNNLGLEVGSVSGRYYIGSMVGYTNGGSISNCYSSGSVTGTDGFVGGLVGYNDGSISNCYSTGDVNGVGSVGGLVGFNYDRVSNCYSTGDVSGEYSVGGLVGGNGGIISNCYSTGDVSGGEGVGGLVGDIGYLRWTGIVSNCYSTGNVSGGEGVGGLVGGNCNGSVLNCYSTGDVNGVSDVGGLVGYNGFYDVWVPPLPGYIYNSYSTGGVNGVDDVGGLVGYNFVGYIGGAFWDVQTSGEPNMCGLQNNDYATGCDPNCGKTTAQMQTKRTFTDAGWDFVEIWGIGEHQTYPYLRFAPAGDFNYDKEVNFLDLAIFASHWLEERK